ncbi:MAG: hypothetical protein CFH08_01544 [Alphaproteobacteria bacterium MarineAlpha3_Bin7]|nr:MAG: hypothetical protein CFH08_01544 [Alphaproteobacteria bacterium MarineAlpha3_Bin7]
MDMRVIIVSIFVFLLMGNTETKISLDSVLKKFSWKKRVVLLIAEDSDTELINGVDVFFKEEICRNIDRNLELYKIIGSQISQYEIPEKFRQKRGMWLIGYDGYDKAYSSDLSLLEELYQIIDKMPIRQNEMLNGVSSCD